jgi:hypothetical protein
MKKITLLSLVATTLGAMAIPFHTADAQLRPSPTPILIAVPSFNCGATVTGTSGTVTITHSNAIAVDKTKDVVATVTTPNGKVSASTCGSAFATSTSAKAYFTAPTTTDKSFIYTCTAVQTTQTFACNPPK